MAETTRILIVDDTRSIHDDFKKVLNSETEPKVVSELENMEQQLFGTEPNQHDAEFHPIFSIDSAYQGQEALAAAENAARIGRPYDLIFVDIRMPPGWDGIETIKKIWERLPDTEMVICTAYSDYSSAEIKSRLGASDRLLLIKKPFDSVALYQMALSIAMRKQAKRKAHNEFSKIERQLFDRTTEVSRLIQKMSTSNSQIEKSYHDLKDMQQKLEATSKIAELGEMTVGIAHEINGPLGTVTMLSNYLKEILEEDPIDKSALKEIATTIEMITFRITKIVKHLQAIFRNEDAEPCSNFNLQELINETLVFTQERYRRAKISLKVHVPPLLVLQARPIQISQVLLNLLNNSFDAVKDLSERWVEIAATDAGANIEISVTDSGTGIPTDIRSRIFAPFFTTKPPGLGTGVGLHISKALIAAHKGQLQLDERSPHTKFVLTLPKIQQMQQMKESTPASYPREVAIHPSWEPSAHQ